MPQTNTLENPLGAIVPVTESPILLAEAHKARITDMLVGPQPLDLTAPESCKLLAGELDGLLQNSLIANETGVLYEEQLSETGNLCLSVLAGVVEKNDRSRSYLRYTNGLTQFEEVIKGMDTLYERTDTVHPPTVKEDTERVTTLLRFSSSARDKIHEKFVDKYAEDLTAEESSIELGVMWQEPEFLNIMGTRFGKRNFDKYKGLTKMWPETEQRLFSKTFKALGFSEEEKKDILAAWNSFDDHTGDENLMAHRIKTIEKSFFVMSTLLSAGPEVVHDIYKMFNIRQFGRYHAHQLYDQLLDFKSPGKGFRAPSRLLVTGTGDWNGAFNNIVDRLSSVLPVYMEASSLDELARALVRAKKMGPIGSLIVAAHGSKDALALSDHGRITTDTMKQSRGLSHLKSKGIFTENAEIILISCATGKEGGIAQNVSRLAGMAVVAATTITGGRIERDKSSEAARFKVIFPDHENDPSLLTKLGIKNDNTAVAYINGKAKKVKPLNLFD